MEWLCQIEQHTPPQFAPRSAPRSFPCIDPSVLHPLLLALCTHGAHATTPGPYPDPGPDPNHVPSFRGEVGAMHMSTQTCN